MRTAIFTAEFPLKIVRRINPHVVRGVKLMDKYCIKLLNKNVTVVTCISLSLENGQISYNDTQVNNEYHVDTVATFTCNYGYSLSGSESSRCATSGNWNKETPKCNLSTKNHIYHFNFYNNIKIRAQI